MLDAHSVITQASEGIVKELANRREISLTRMYELLGDQCVYPKTKVLIRDIADVDKERARIIFADLHVLEREIFGAESKAVDVAEIHRESSEAVAALLENKPGQVVVRELREMCAAGEKALSVLEAGNHIN